MEWGALYCFISSYKSLIIHICAYEICLQIAFYCEKVKQILRQYRQTVKTLELCNQQVQEPFLWRKNYTNIYIEKYLRQPEKYTSAGTLRKWIWPGSWLFSGLVFRWVLAIVANKAGNLWKQNNKNATEKRGVAETDVEMFCSAVTWRQEGY